MSKWIRAALRLAVWPRRRLTVAVLALVVVATLLGVATAGVQALSPSATTATVTSQVSSSADDANEVDGVLSLRGATVWLGNAASGSVSYAAMRFTGVPVPQNAIVRSAHLEVHSSQSQWIAIGFDIRAESSGNSAAFATGSLPSQRTLTTQVVKHASNTAWTANTWYSLDEIAPVIQEVVSRSDWQQGNSLAVIMLGTGAAWGRKAVDSFDSTPANAPRLVIQFDASSAATSTPTPTGVASPTSTATPTPTKTPAPGATSTSSPTATPASVASVGSAFFPIGPGYVDVVPHQVIRADNGRLYIFASEANAPSVIQAYRTTGTAPPSSGSDFASTSVNTGADIVSLAAAYGGGNVVHVLVNTQTGAVRDYPYDLTTDTFRPVKTLATGSASAYGLGTSGLAAMFSRSGLLHVAYWASGDRIIYQSYRYDASSDAIQTVSGPVPVDSGGRIARHPALAVSPLDDSVIVAWISPQSASNQGPGDVFVRTLSSAGAWGAVIRVNQAPAWTSTNSGIDIDQGPSVVVGKDGVVHLAYIENYDSSGMYGRVHYVRGSQASWTDGGLAIYSHDPSLAIDGSGALWLLGHGYPLDAACLSMTNICVSALGAQGQWGPFQLFAKAPNSDSFDASVSTKWSVVGWNQPGVVEFAFFSANGGSYSNTTLYYGRLAGSISSQGPAPTATPTATRTSTSTSTATATATSAPASTATPTATRTSTSTSTATPSATPTQAPTTIPDPCAGLPAGQYCAEYFANSTLTGAATYRVAEPSPINHDWATGDPGNGIPNDNFSARWTGSFIFPASGTYTFTAAADDGVRVWVDNVLVIDRWIDQAQATYKASVPLIAGNHIVKMEYYEHTGLAVAQLGWAMGCSVGQVMAEYYSGTTPPTDGTLPVVSMCESTPIDHDWGTGGPGSGVGVDSFSARWTGLVSFTTAGTHTFTATADDGIRVWVDGTLLIDQWQVQASTVYTASMSLSAGTHIVKVEYFEQTGLAVAKLSWTP